MQDVISEEEKKQNFDRMLAVQNKISFEKNQSYIGKTVKVLCEGYSKTDSNKMCGRTDSGKIVNFGTEKDLTGTFVDVQITEAKTWNLQGEPYVSSIDLR